MTLSRRRLLQLVPPVLVFGAAGCRTGEAPGSPDANPDAEDSARTDSAGTDTRTSDDCDATDDDIEGPFYREGAPERDDLVVDGDTGTELILSGRVLRADGCTPIAAAVVDLWQAAPDGTYDNTSEEMRYRGRVRTDAEGRWSIRTFEPGRYLNGSQYRPAHLHVKIRIDDVDRLTTQLYFPGDPYNASDPWYAPERELTRTGGSAARFDFTV